MSSVISSITETLPPLSGAPSLSPSEVGSTRSSGLPGRRLPSELELPGGAACERSGIERAPFLRGHGVAPGVEQRRLQRRSSGADSRGGARSLGELEIADQRPRNRTASPPVTTR